MPTIITDGAASAQGYGFAARSVAANYIEDVFSTYLYTGTGASLTITNGIDLSTKGGLVWIKQRSGAQDHTIFDTARGVNNYLRSNSTGAQNPGGTYTDLLTAFNSSGFSLGADASTAGFVNASGSTYVSWTFREQPKFFDVVTYTGTGANRTIAHNLGSVPGCIMIKRTDTTAAWAVYHRSRANTRYMVLNTTAAVATGATYWNNTTPTSSVFSLGTSTDVNASGGTYVAYLFAHDAGGFGATGADNVISCGSFTTDGSSTATIDLSWEPQWVLVKTSNVIGNWTLVDTMRGWVNNGSSLTSESGQVLRANTSGAELSPGSGSTQVGRPFQTGFTWVGAPSDEHIYIAIRRGPMRTPTTGTSVFSPIATSAGTGTTQTTGFVIDSQLAGARSLNEAQNWSFSDRLRSISSNSTQAGLMLATSSTQAEQNYGNSQNNWTNTTFNIPTYWGGVSAIYYSFRRAPGFFDVVCYTGTGVARTVSHNLGVAPELMIVKSRNTALDWYVYHKDIGNTKYIRLNIVNFAQTSSEPWNNTTPTSSVFTTGIGYTNESAITYVAYLFATVAGVSKVGSYTGTAALQTINCGFTGGARFVLIKRTDSTGDWYVWDSARGISSGNDPYLLLNSTAAEVTGTNYVDTTSVGFQVTAAAPAGINANGGTYIFLAIA